MVLHIIRAEILQVAEYFSEPRRGAEQYEQRAKCPHVLYGLTYNTFCSRLVLSFLDTACIARELHRPNKRARVTKTTQTK